MFSRIPPTFGLNTSSYPLDTGSLATVGQNPTTPVKLWLMGCFKHSRCRARVCVEMLFVCMSIVKPK